MASQRVRQQLREALEAASGTGGLANLPQTIVGADFLTTSISILQLAASRTEIVLSEGVGQERTPYPEPLETRVEVVERKIGTLGEELQRVKSELEELRATLPGEVITLRTVGRKQARREILKMFRIGETLYYSDISRRLRIDLPLVVELCQELEEEGEIVVDADALRQG